MAGRRWSAFAALATLTMLIGVNVPRGHAQGRGTGWLLAAYRETGGPRPAWVTDAVGRSLAHLARQGKYSGPLVKHTQWASFQWIAPLSSAVKV